ncbi:GGDEF domain-containing protein [Kineosporia succinea]|uniref:Diguanylate cyclase (GGDEF)-like protein n=1 Tax=Kineosporia succinea TaxID=84632 RepID=A0ABT9PAM2_9ACTN|nr:GGDEF domain-containing protein [Kineosporia succinea]MDP9829735.1 diguanylate cyclase (GGDEF)-like protein [Kineosporia succinea]
MSAARPEALFRLHLVTGAVLSVVCVCLPRSLGRDGLYTLISCGCVVMFVVGVRRHRPVRARSWWLITAGLVVWAAADLLWAVYTWILDISPFPSPADVLYLTSYVLIAGGFWSFVRARRGENEREGLTDAAIFTVGCTLISWVLLMRPGLEAAQGSTTAQVLAAAYPLGDVLMLALLVRLLTTNGARNAAFRWLVAGNTLLLIADSAYQYTTRTETYTAGLITLPWLLSYVCFAAAALHPSMRHITDGTGTDETAHFTRGRLVALTVASLVAPGTLLLQLTFAVSIAAWAVGLASVVLFLLVVYRMSGLLTRLDAQASQLAALARTDALTGLPNRRTSDAELQRLQTRARTEGVPLCVGVLDLDRFKAFNDTYGHQAGDGLLVTAAAAWHEHLESARVGVGLGRSMMLGRWGGEEFVLLLLGHDLAGAAAVLDSLRATTPAGQTFSAGVACWDGLESAGEVFARADAALYTAKSSGRDRVHAAASAPAAPVSVDDPRSGETLGRS